MPYERFTEQGVLDAAMDLLREKGYEALTARAVAERVHCSVQPIYRQFGNMDGLMEALYQHACAWVTNYNRKHAEVEGNQFASNGRAHIRLAQDEPQLFTFLYLSPYMRVRGADDLYELGAQPGVLETIEKHLGLNEDAARGLYLDLIVYTHGIASLIAEGAEFPEEDLARMMNGAFFAFLHEHGGSVPAGKEPES
ncbi:TetR/AcrR family transcriptional regulator [Curtanaerobium respiraculi]|uniref:TetR/AcrR family transcriptional regulator n=1 Tax=Curtanaerobium respiraculi TaxID=2949669 RepID=UPI0024B34829|nr:TetR/AcrR family transcriptional regulator [Curtanaerobium respiraculi]